MNDNENVNYSPDLQTDDQDTIFVVKFWKRAADRAIKTFLYTLAVTLAGPAVATGTTASFGSILSVPWQGAVSLSLAATILSIGGSLAGKKIGNNPADPAWFNTK